MSEYPPRRKARKSGNGPLICLIAVMLAALAMLVVLAMSMGDTSMEDPLQTTEQTTLQTTQTTTEATTDPPTEPRVVKQTTATIGATGDILMHQLVIDSGYDRSSDTYDYNYIFQHFSKAVSQVDYAVANLEVTLCGKDNGYNYSGYPCFNSPDAIVDALKNAGFDLLLTANNHTYDTGSKGFTRTQQVIEEKGLPHIGTRPSPEDKSYTVADVNGIKIGMINYTYNTGVNSDGSVSLNGIKLSVDSSRLINSFSYDRLDAFYKKLEGEVAAMRQDGAEAIVIYIHWGNEYNIKENSTQNAIAQQLCNLGIDVIVGNHAHVPQPVELLQNENDQSKKTLCLYSTGNAVSNIYRNKKFPANTEDGMLFTFTFAKYSDGTVIVEGAKVIPTWVYRYYDNSSVRKFLVMVMDDREADWQNAMGLTDSQFKECQASYERTMGIVGEGITQANEYYRSNREAVEAALGIEA